MYLKALEIQGFKSFPDKTVLTFGEDITAIVGPNGTGKSNISDAIRWVMGEQSTRILRGSRMEDVIFGGTARRRQTGYAEVSLVLDNTTHIIDMDASEVMVTRRYYRSGESEYYINRHSVRLKDLHELFMDTGLGREGYSIIGQGRIDEILSVRSSERRDVFEEAAGISRFRHRKEEAEGKLKRTDENLLRINDKIGELELQVEPLRRQSEQARKFLLLRDELRTLEISMWLDTLEQIRISKIKLELDYQQAVSQREEVRTAQDSAYANAEQFSQQMHQRDVEADRIRFALQGRQAKSNELESQIAVLKSNIVHNLESAQRIQSDLAQQEGREDSLSAQITQRQNRLQGLERQLQDRQTSIAHKRQQVQQTEQSVGTLSQELANLQRQFDQGKTSASEEKALLSALAAAAQEVLDRDETIRQELVGLGRRLMLARQEEQAAEERCEQAAEERNAVQNVIQGYQLRVDAREKKAQQLREKQTNLQMERSGLGSRIKLLTEMERAHEGYSKAVKLVMEQTRRGGLKHIHGPVADLIKVPDLYTTAIETALGGAMQNIVVEQEEDGKAVIHFLKHRDGGRVTMLPLSSIRPSRLHEQDRLKEEPGVVGIGDQLVSFAREYGDVFSHLLGRVVVMEDLDSAIATARKYKYQFRIVTLDGQVLNPGGSMTGGSASRSAGILSRANELKRLNIQEQEMVEQLAQVEQELSQAVRETTAARYELETAQGKLRICEDTILKGEAHLSHCRSVRDELVLQQKGGETQLEQLGVRSAQIEEDTQRARQKIQQLEGHTAALQAETEGKRQGQAALRERSALIAQELADLTADRAALEAERDAICAGLKQLEELRAGMAGDRSQSQGLLADYERKNKIHLQDIEQKQKELVHLEQERAQQMERVASLNQEKLALEGERIRATKHSQSLNEQLLRMEGEVSRLEQQRLSMSMEEKQLLDKLWENYELSHEAARQQRIDIDSVSKASRRVAELKRSISELGSVNVGAIEEFERVNQRYTYLTEQRDDVSRAKGELEHIISGITTEMKTIFTREFSEINRAFAQTFTELFDGGKATLELEDPKDILNCGIEIKVQPPGKALKTITLLSGGEKAFVAIALYFAILKVRPTPFVVMDEIEAALDDNNVVRFAQYMRAMAKNSQFIVITHRRGTMEEADVLYGVTMQEKGVSRMLTINLNEVEQGWNIR